MGGFWTGLGKGILQAEAAKSPVGSAIYTAETGKSPYGDGYTQNPGSPNIPATIINQLAGLYARKKNAAAQKSAGISQQSASSTAQGAQPRSAATDAGVTGADFGGGSELPVISPDLNYGVREQYTAPTASPWSDYAITSDPNKKNNILPYQSRQNQPSQPGQGSAPVGGLGGSAPSGDTSIGGGSPSGTPPTFDTSWGTPGDGSTPSDNSGTSTSGNIVDPSQWVPDPNSNPNPPDVSGPIYDPGTSSGGTMQSPNGSDLYGNQVPYIPPDPGGAWGGFADNPALQGYAPSFARGGIMGEPGIARVSESGPESVSGHVITQPSIVKLNKGESVIPLTPRPENKLQPDLLEGHLAAPKVPGLNFARYKAYGQGRSLMR